MVHPTYNSRRFHILLDGLEPTGDDEGSKTNIPVHTAGIGHLEFVSGGALKMDLRFEARLVEQAALVTRVDASALEWSEVQTVLHQFGVEAGVPKCLENDLGVGGVGGLEVSEHL